MADQKLSQLGSLGVSEDLGDLLYTVSATNQYKQTKSKLYQHFLNSTLSTGFQCTGQVRVSGIVGGDWLSSVANPNNVTGRGSSILAGYNHSIKATFCAVVAGSTNQAFANASAILAGDSNTTYGEGTAIGCGLVNISSGEYSFVGGGTFNKLEADYNFLGAGEFNKVSGIYSAVVGDTNNAGKARSIVGAGYKNNAYADDAGVFCGAYNTGEGGSSFIGGGAVNRVYVNCGFNSILGGSGNEINANLSNINGGSLHVINAGADGSCIGGGFSNICNDDFGVIGGGNTNFIQVGGQYSVIAGGYGGSIFDGNYGFVGGGNLNGSQALYGVVCGGSQNYAVGEGSVVIGGNSCLSSGYYSVCLGGISNYSSGRFSITAGQQTRVSGDFGISMGRRGIIERLHSGAVVFCDGKNQNHHSQSFDSMTSDFASGVFLRNGNLKLHLGLRIPTFSTDPGTNGEVAVDGNNLYICIAPNSWKLIPLTSF